MPRLLGLGDGLFRVWRDSQPEPRMDGGLLGDKEHISAVFDEYLRMLAVMESMAPQATEPQEKRKSKTYKPPEGSGGGVWVPVATIPGTPYSPSLDFSDDRNSQYMAMI